jgi:nitrate reductase cytochrome c-type subunit
MGTQATEVSATRAMPAVATVSETRPQSRYRTLACHCPGCGSEVTFDALVVTCLCSDDLVSKELDMGRTPVH